MKRKKKLTSRESAIAWATDNGCTITMVPVRDFRWMIEVRYLDDQGGIPLYSSNTWEDVWYQIQHDEWRNQKPVKII